MNRHFAHVHVHGRARRRRRVWLASVAALGLCLTFAACGGDDQPSGEHGLPPAPDCGAASPAMDAAAGDGRVDDAATSDAAPTVGPSATDLLFDDDAPVRAFKILVEPADWAWQQANATKEQYVPAVVVYQGVTYPDAQVRYKGGFGSLNSCFDAQGKRLCNKLSIKVSFNETDKSGRFHGVRKLVFNACNRDDTCLRERLSYAFFRRAGVLAPRSVHARVQVNDDPAALYLLVENVDKEFVQDHFAWDKGNLYKETWPDSADPNRYIQGLKTNKDKPDVTRMVTLATALKQTPESGFVALADTWIDRAAMSRYFAVDQLTNNWDGIWKFYCANDAYCGNHNFFIYDDQGGSGRVVVIPWDLDHTYNSPNPDMARSWWDDGPDACKVKHDNPIAGIRAPQCDPLLRGLMRQGWKDYLARIDALTAQGGPLGLKAQLALLDRYRAMIAPEVKLDALGPAVAVWEKATAVLRVLVIEQHAQARALLEWTGP